MIPEFEAGIFLTSKNQGGRGPETPAGKYPATVPPSFDLEAAYGIAGEAGGSLMTEFKLQDLRFKYRELYLKNHLGITKAPCLDCRTAYAGAGLLAIPFLLKASITNSGCTWEKLELRERQIDLGRQKDQERLEFFSNLVNELIIETP